MAFNEVVYQKRYLQLNEFQKDAVDSIYGAVMVIAGPGTGKTEVLSMRIANLLRSEVQVLPHEILCLTYTEEATNAMRRRLVQIIGPEAHKVNIFTFHSFCNTVIQNNSNYFSFRNLQPINDLELAELLHKLLENLPQGHNLRRLSGNIYTDTQKLKKLFDTMKKEHLSPEAVSVAIDKYLTLLPENEKYIYKRGGTNNRTQKKYVKGDLKQDLIDDEIQKMETTRAAAFLLDDYDRLLKNEGKYDFNDMILWVLQAFETNQALLQSYQERYQFILVDEFQDTNGSQNELLNSLSSFWDDPNIFVVGDDDQGIYEFQGARIRNIVDFYRKYEDNIKIIVLTYNYRSSQYIIDKAIATINNNNTRLINELKELGLNKNIIAAAPRFDAEKDNITPKVCIYNKILQEEADLVFQIEQLQNTGISLKEIAVIYAQHKQANNIMDLLERKGIPFNAKKELDILQEPIIEQILKIIEYIDKESKKPFDGEDVLFELLHAPCFGIVPVDIALLSLFIQNKRSEKIYLKWKIVLLDTELLNTLNLNKPDAIIKLGLLLQKWEQEHFGLTLPLLIEKIIHEGGIVSHIIDSIDHIWGLQVLHTFFEFIKESYNSNPKIKIADLLTIFKRMEVEKISLPLQRVIQNENGVYFYTAHGAKGNEFEYVFLIGCTKNFWENKHGGNNEYRMPDTITLTNEDPEKTYKTEVARRLFYVALTRAKKHLQISYALNDNAGKAIEASVFVDEISDINDRVVKQVSAETILDTLGIAIQPVPVVSIKMANAQWINRVLQQFTLSYTTFSKFLHCPLTFYYEVLLKVPFQKNDALAFGSAIHHALEVFFIAMKERKGTFPDKDFLVNSFVYALNKEAAAFTNVQIERRLEQGTDMLTHYYNHYIDTLYKEVEIELNIPRYFLDGVPITGKIDKIEIYGDTCKVIDYKTGDPDKSATPLTSPPNDKEPHGGDYWRQMVFYKLLLENYTEKNRIVTLGMFDFVQKNKKNEYKQIVVPVNKKDEEFVLLQLKETYNSIMNHEFNTGCGKDDCRWCNFARKFELIRPNENMYNEI